MPKKLGGHAGPKPLRDAHNLMGFAHLDGADLIKVTLANNLYRAAISLLRLCCLTGCLVSLENPARSWLWQLLAMLVKQTTDNKFMDWYSKLESVYFDACAHGSSRDKRTKLLATENLFSHLAQDCPGDHTHASWQPYQGESGVIFPTAMEAEYPALLCKRMATCVLDAATSHGVSPTLQPRLKELLQLGLGTQTVRHQPLVAEYLEVQQLDSPCDLEAYKLLSAPSNQGHQTPEQPAESPQKRPKTLTTYKYGVWHTPEQFLEKAQKVTHPMDDESYLHPATKEAIRKVVSTEPLKLARERLVTVFNLRKLADELKAPEATLKESLHPDVRRCVHTKNILLFERTLEQLGFWDMGVVDLLKFGIPLVGLQPTPKGYRQQLVPATISEDELLQSATWRRQLLMYQTKSFSLEEERELLTATGDEVKRGFLQGPYLEDEISVLMGTTEWSLNPRFILFQGDGSKVRVIDDARKSSVNAAYSSTTKLQLQDVDYAANMVCHGSL